MTLPKCYVLTRVCNCLMGKACTYYSSIKGDFYLRTYCKYCNAVTTLTGYVGRRPLPLLACNVATTLSVFFFGVEYVSLSSSIVNAQKRCF